ncbi:ComEA family DNA-binding protein [Legionella jordanis]|uniref:Competence protein ComEA n=1 Tax=Legionella jordanis TaxID=456 RepID=A0A0W0VFM8_9GAMM|nr:helix-hairpin-helix domain-containing protein [Legionella jordanis]KTD18920.1 competence protein ComEA [Legionella jordanis]RMX05516.1 helix-hairpin-helix domain-containing protein [Legionella jordanis]RMX19201.1 helix-hairpin-helix domain-containing protein [Legionella jordanis]VEH13020.1 competence protein ComEA [Legionella jordanis]HAT8714063.1 helix-hairpin-helix domain-containing protein [Legionella jordanis]
MKANLFAAVLSLCVIALPLQAAKPSPASTEKSLQAPAKINLNKADAKQLSQSVKGIGPKRAQAIVKFREEHGLFKSIDELAQVKGIGRQFVKNNLEQLQAIFSVN